MGHEDQDFVYPDEGGIGAGLPMEVFMDVCCKGGRPFFAGGMWLPLCELEKRLSPVAANNSPHFVVEKASETKKADVGVLPWALDLLGASVWSAGSTIVGAASSASQAPEATGGDSDEDKGCIVGAAQVMAELQARRTALTEVGEVEANFRWRLRGVAWTAANKGLTYDAFSGGPIVKGGLAEAWCSQWGVIRTASWLISAYGEDAALIMAKAWVHLHEWLFRTCLAHRGAPAGNSARMSWRSTTSRAH